jgi:hypothetical protein
LNKIAKIEFKPQENIENNEDKHLSDFLKIRQTNRYNGKRVEILDKTIEYITKEIGKYNTKIHIYKSENELDQISEILSELEKIRTLDSWGSKDFVNEIRWTDKEAQSKLDGIELESIHLTEAEKAGLIVSKSQTVISLIKEWDKGDAFKKLTKKTLDSASCICVLTMPDWTELDFLNAGSVLENMWVRANSINISFQPISASVFLYYRLMNDKINLNKVDNSTIVKMNELLPSYNKYFPINEFEKSIFIFRLSFSEGKTKESIRKPVEELLTFN